MAETEPEFSQKREFRGVRKNFAFRLREGRGSFRIRGLRKKNKSLTQAIENSDDATRARVVGISDGDSRAGRRRMVFG